MAKKIEIVPFGKYKGQPIGILAQDKSYCEWLQAQDWMAQRFPELRTIIINQFHEPEDTPEHNALQLRFLDPHFLAQCSQVWLQNRPDIPYCDSKAMDCLQRVGNPRFEECGHDVSWEIAAWLIYHGEKVKSEKVGLETVYQTIITSEWCDSYKSLSVECKPSLGNEYPSVLRAITSRKWGQGRLCVIEQFTASNVQFSQVQQVFRSSGILLVTVAEIEAAIPRIVEKKEDLPDAALYIR